MTLLDKQFAFSRLIVELIEEAYRRGYTLTLGEMWRPPETAALYAKQGKGIKNSLHTQRLAVDLNLFLNGKFLTKTEDYEGLGLFWENLSTPGLQCCWGGRFKDSRGRPRPDGNHFSIAHEGRK